MTALLVAYHHYSTSSTAVTTKIAAVTIIKNKTCNIKTSTRKTTEFLNKFPIITLHLTKMTMTVKNCAQ